MSMKRISLKTGIKFFIWWFLTILFTILTLFLFHENGFGTKPSAIAIYDDSYLKSIFITLIYALYYLGWVYLIFMLMLHYLILRFDLNNLLRIAILLTVSYGIFFTFYVHNSTGTDEIVLGLLVFGTTSIFSVLFYNFLFKVKY